MSREEKEEKGSNERQHVAVKKDSGFGSLRSIFMHADGVDKLLMALGVMGSMGDGFTTPLVLFITSRLMNNIGGSSSENNFTHDINKVLVLNFFG